MFERCPVEIGGKAAGTVGTAGVYSFGLYKNVTAFYGGMVVTDDDKLAVAVRAVVAEMPPISAGFLIKKVISGLITDFITWPFFFRLVTFRLFRYGLLNDVDAINNQLKIDVDPKITYDLPPGYRHRPSPLQARLILPQISRARAITQERIANANIYREGLKEIDGILLPPKKGPLDHMYWYLPLQCQDREGLVKFSMKAGRDLTLSYHRNCSAMPCFEEYANPCPNAQETADSVVYLPTYPGYSRSEIDANLRVICQYFEAR